MDGTSATMPVVFFGHGSPMVALEHSATTRAWAAIGRAVGKPRAILCVSAHWITRGTAVTAMAHPKTIHDFGAFPQALFDVRYPAPGDAALARRVRELLAPTPVALDAGQWGLDHGTWSVLVHAFPNADVPVVQLSMDAGIDEAARFEIGRALSPLRDEGVLIVASGNIVHNLPRMDWQRRDTAFDWARRFNDHIRDAIADDRPEGVIRWAERGQDAQLSVPTPDHFWPLLYALGARRPGESASFGPDHIEHGSLGMTTVVFGAAAAPLSAAA